MDAELIRRYLSQTRILRAPRKALATFGATQLDYHLISPVEDMEGRTRLRRGKVVSQRPKIITPDAFLERFEGFGDDSGDFAKWLGSAYQDLLRALEYNFKNQGFTAHVLSEKPEVVADRVTAELDAKDDRAEAVIRCPDGAWALALMKFALDESARSFPVHVRDLERRGLFNAPIDGREEKRREIERLFTAAANDPRLVRKLGDKLREYGLFPEYEDRYFSLYPQA